jgi:hypothetical protein
VRSIARILVIGMILPLAGCSSGFPQAVAFPISGRVVSTHGLPFHGHFLASVPNLRMLPVARDDASHLELLTTGSTGCPAPTPSSITTDAPNLVVIRLPPAPVCAGPADLGVAVRVLWTPGVAGALPLQVVVIVGGEILSRQALAPV